MATPIFWVLLAGGVHAYCHVYEPQSAHGGLAFVLLTPAFFLFFGHVTPTLFSVLTSYCYFICSLCVSIVLYRLSPLHPLYHVPGPPLWRVSKIIGLWMSWTGHQHHYIKRAHDKYGPIVRTVQSTLTPLYRFSVLRDSPKGQYYECRKDPRAPLNLVVLQGDAHANRRRLWNRGMSTESLKEYEGIIAKRGNQLLDCIADLPDLNRVDLAALISYFSFDFMGDMAFGGGFDLLANEVERTNIWPIIEKFAVAASIYSHVPWAAATLRLIPLPARDRLRNFGADNAYRRSKSTTTTKDLWYHLMDEAALEKQKPPLGDVIADGALAVVAGADTTASALASLFYFLLSHPEYYKQLQEEVDAHFPLGSDPLDTSSHAEMKFLNACINEALRLHPPVPTNGPRQVPAGSQGKIIAGLFIPEGTQVYVPPYSLHLDSRYFSPSPTKFIPERWIDPALAPNATAFIPFSYGPSNCVGRNLARQEMAMLTCLLLSRFEFRFSPGFDAAAWPMQLHDHFITTRGPLIVSVSKR
ncbi:Cytochrome P450 [Mycena venus]|uniref:Cytochrome P450 n=1 Tax=Mycena venus TaxID=2733690 RepID=A0A8H7CBR6_9AGAR|nr:Cytochrome P450 [Mycena venus]